MKVLVLSTKLPFPPKDGGAIASLNLSLGLAGAGCEVTMLTFNTKKHYFPPQEIPSAINNKIRIISVETDTSLKIFDALWNLLFTRKPYIAERFKNKEFSNELERLLSSQSFDIIQLEGPYLSHYLPLIRNLSKAKISLRAHNIEHEIWRRKAINEQALGSKLYLISLARRIKKLELEILDKVDMVIPISERDHKIISELKPGVRGISIPTGINIEDYQINKIEIENSVFFLGSLDWLPNQEGMVWYKKNVLPYLEKEITVPLMHFAGRNAPEELLKALKHPSMVYHGEVEDAKAFMEKYSVMAVPLLTGSGIRIKIIEGMALGKCVVTTTKGAEGIPVTDGENILIANDEETFAKYLAALISDSELRTKISMNARKFIQEKFDNLAISTKLRDFYKQQI